jgi:hypothetical protein
MRETLTDGKGRPLCLAYRQGKRCRRLAVVVGVYQDHTGRRTEQALCRECAQRLGAEISQESARGFAVSTRNSGGWISRHYLPPDSGKGWQ